MGLFSSIAGIFGSNKKKKAAQQAAAAQTAAFQQGIDATSAQNELLQQQLEPYLTAGDQALGQQSNLLGLNGAGVQLGSIDALKASPLYQSLFGNGEDAILANGSATGGLRGGNTQRSLADFGRDTLAQTIEAQLSRLGGLSGQGLSAATNGGALGAQSVAQLTALLSGQGQAKAGGILGAANADLEKYGNIANLVGSAIGSFNFGGGGQQSGGGLNLAALAKAFI